MISRVAFLAASILTLLSPTEALAQAWAGAEGQLNVSLTSSFHYSDAVYYGDFGKITDLSTQAFSNTLGAEFTPLPKLTISADFTYFSTKYTGPQMGASADILLPHGTQDDGSWHGDLQDMNIGARYQLTTDPVAFSPMISVRIPMKDYEQMGYAQTGQGLKQLALGLFLGRIGIGLDGLFAEGGYMFNYVETLNEGPAVEEFRVHYSLLRGTIGYFLGDRFTVSVGMEHRQPHGGLELDEFATADPQVQLWHDPIMARQYTSLTVLAGYQLTDNLGIGAGFANVLAGNNVSDAKVFGLNLSYTAQLFEEDVPPPEPEEFNPEDGDEGSLDPDDYSDE